MEISSGIARAAAAAIALVCWAGLTVQFNAILDQGMSSPATLWIMARYFTILTNFIVAIVFTGLALGKAELIGPSLLGGTTMAIVLVGVVYHVLLRGLLELSGGAKLADTILHYVTPMSVMAFWLFLAPRGALTRRDPPFWTAYPLVYLVYALVRGEAEKVYAYPFLNVGNHGWLHVAITSLLIFFAFLAGGFGLVWADGVLAKPSRAAIPR